MTNAAWETMADGSVHRYHRMPIVYDYPQWWMLEILDRFGSCIHNLPSLKKCVINKVLSLKDERDLSSFNQAYNREVSKSDKMSND